MTIYSGIPSLPNFLDRLTEWRDALQEYLTAAIAYRQKHGNTGFMDEAWPDHMQRWRHARGCGQCLTLTELGKGGVTATEIFNVWASDEDGPDLNDCGMAIIALSHNIVANTQVNTTNGKIKKSKRKQDLEIMGEHPNLTPEQVEKYRGLSGNERKRKLLRDAMELMPFAPVTALATYSGYTREALYMKDDVKQFLARQKDQKERNKQRKLSGYDSSGEAIAPEMKNEISGSIASGVNRMNEEAFTMPDDEDDTDER